MIKTSSSISLTAVHSPKNGRGDMDKKELLQKDEMYGKGRTLSELFLHPQCAMGFHEHHGDNEIYYILSGEGLYNDNGKEIPVKAGDVCIVNDGEGHSIANVGTEDLHVIALVLNS